MTYYSVEVLKVRLYYECASDGEGVLQVIITGGAHGTDDIAFPPAVAEQLDRIGPRVLNEFKRTGLTFAAGVE